MGFARVEQNPLGGSRFARINVGNDSNISVSVQINSRHFYLPTIMSEGSVRLRHSVGILFFLYRGSGAIRSVCKLAGEFLSHGLA
jgi:hypothetical protein